MRGCDYARVETRVQGGHSCSRQSSLTDTRNEGGNPHEEIIMIFIVAPYILETIYYTPTNTLLYCNSLKYLH